MIECSTNIFGCYYLTGRCYSRCYFCCCWTFLNFFTIIRRYYESWAAVLSVASDPAALIHLTSTMLSSVVFSLTVSNSKTSTPMSVPFAVGTDTMASVSSAVSAGSYNDVLSAWAAGAQAEVLEVADDSFEISESYQSSNGNLIPVAENAEVTSTVSPPLMNHSSSHNSLQNSPLPNENSGESGESFEKHSESSPNLGLLKILADGKQSKDKDQRSVVSLPFLSSPSRPDLGPISKDSNDEYSYAELKHLLLSILQEKQTLEKRNRDLESKAVEIKDRLVELETTVETLRRRETDLIAAHQLRVSAAARENDILKQQLKKYIAQLQNQSGNGPVESSQQEDKHERKVLELSEMHGELMEFVELLQRRLRIKEARLATARKQLTALRGPLPAESDDESERLTGEIVDNVPPQVASSNQLIHVWVPLVFLKAAGSPHHIYQIYVRLRDDEWNVFRRYSELHAFHTALRKRYPQAAEKVPFPPKKSMGNRKPDFVEQRRQALQTYLRTVLDLLTRVQPEFQRVTRAKLLLLLPFFNEKVTAAGATVGPLTSNSSTTQLAPGNDRSRTYTGL